MTIQEMIENAVLDAVGLLDDDEQVEFERAFDSASPKIQAMVRAEQTRLSNISGLLPCVEPPVSLKAEVIGRVREAIAAAYLAQETTLAKRPLLELIPSRKVSPIWRAAAIGSLAAAVVFGVSVTRMTDEYDRLRDAIGKDQLLEQITQQFGSRYVEDMIYDPDVVRVVFGSASTDFVGKAAVFFSDSWDEQSRFFSTKLSSKDGQRFRLVVVDQNDSVVKELASFEASGGLVDAEMIDFDPRDLSRDNVRLAVFAEGGEDGEDKLLLRSIV